MTDSSPQSPKQILNRLAAPQSKRLRASGWLSVLSALIWPVQAAVVGLVLGHLVAPGVSPALSPLAGALCFVALALVRIALDWAAQKLGADAAEAIVIHARSRLVAQAARQATGAAALSPAHSAALVAEKLAALTPWATRYQPSFMRARIVPLAFLVIAATQSWVVALILLIAGPLIPIFMALIGMAAQQASEKQMIEIGALNSLLIDRIAAMSDLRLLGAEGRAREVLKDKTEDLRRRTMAVLRVAFLSSTVLELFSALGVAMVAMYVGFSLIGWMHFGTWGAPMTPATGIFLLMIAPEFFQPLRDLAAAWHDRAAALAVGSELDTAETEIEAARKILGDGGAGQPLAGGILRWQGLRLRPARDAAPIALPDGAVAPGEAVAITGPSGVGKTTLLSALAGLLESESGTIEWGTDVLDAQSADAWRAGLGWLPQVPRFADTSLRGLITLGREGDLDGALSAAAAQDIIAGLPGGLETRLGDMGGGVSGGEARRLLIARAHYARRPLLLADEPTADLDPDTAAKVIAGLVALREAGITLIVASHDPALVAAMDRAIALEGVA
ncbi:cysteine ABC transporter permease [Thioclava dalianensis]|uniref:Cysteine ABC transporter permease n=1 Tax=Thioclava dalianensis TaxID=1185766 RepID=A0A074TBS5_9RHOB|nr:ATP-binding cassette domain-containing protein [Thioclava dalianensis]KEP69169.1 cysteine ABC transporter permease [Thioclava dalianensis]SFM91418.1 ATP-binding cassette, subfamily C, CydD [Thioclava dalianensis]